MSRESSSSRDQKKERYFRKLVDLLREVGIEVRREELRRGHGWKAVSGSCRLGEAKILFVDRRMTQDEQISFLMARMRVLGLSDSEFSNPDRTFAESN